MEPGIWAGDSKKSGFTPPDPRVVLGVRIPIPEIVRPHVDGALPHYAICSMAVTSALTKHDPSALERLTPHEKKCVVARLHEVCLKRQMKSFDAGSIDADLRKMSREMKKTAKKFTQQSCSERGLTAATNHLFDGITQTWASWGDD